MLLDLIACMIILSGGGAVVKRRMQESLNISEKQFEEVYKEVSNILYSK